MKVSSLLIAFIYYLTINGNTIESDKEKILFYENNHEERYLIFGWFTDMFKRLSNRLSSAASATTVYEGVKKVGSKRRDKRGREILMDLYDSTGGKSWKSSAGWGEDWMEVCDWSGISCNDFIITKVELSGYGLRGTIPEQVLQKLYLLETLDLSNNKLTGTIPRMFGRLLNLNTLNLSGNKLTGTIPPNLSNLMKLKSLNLSQNRISGTIPKSLGELSTLESLHLEQNKYLDGGMPNEICLLYQSWANNAAFESFHTDLLNDYCDEFLDLIGASLRSCNDMMEYLPESNLQTISADCTIGNDDCPCCMTHWTPCCYDDDGNELCQHLNAQKFQSTLSSISS